MLDSLSGGHRVLSAGLCRITSQIARANAMPIRLHGKFVLASDEGGVSHLVGAVVQVRDNDIDRARASHLASHLDAANLDVVAELILRVSERELKSELKRMSRKKKDEGMQALSKDVVFYQHVLLAKRDVVFIACKRETEQ